MVQIDLRPSEIDTVKRKAGRLLKMIGAEQFVKSVKVPAALHDE
jgi:hypothetical protein